jgi:hypothetical protein
MTTSAKEMQRHLCLPNLAAQFFLSSLLETPLCPEFHQ